MKTRITFFVFALLALILLAVPVSARRPVRGTTTRISVATDGSEANGESGSYTGPSISADGRHVAFNSEASNLVSNDTNDSSDIFVHNWRTGLTERVSVSSGGGQANSASMWPSISADGRYVAFMSLADNLVEGDTNGLLHTGMDIFVHDRQQHVTERVSIGWDGSEGNGGSLHPSISGDGRYVAFESEASNLVTVDTNDAYDVFVRDRVASATELVSLSTSGTQASYSYSQAVPIISPNGRYIVFTSGADNLVAGDTNDGADAFVHDRWMGVTERVSVASDGSEGNGWSWGDSISGDGRYVAFTSSASNLVVGDTNDWNDAFVHDRRTGLTERVSVAPDGTQGSDDTFGAMISADGRYVAFASHASELFVGDEGSSADIFVYDRLTGLLELVSSALDGGTGNDDSFVVSISADGRYMAFASFADDLIASDTNDSSDVFVRDRRGAWSQGSGG